MVSEIIDLDAQAIPSPLGPMVMLRVLTKAIDGFRVYRAVIPDNSIVDPYYTEIREWVKAHGQKLRVDEAATIWPMITPENYAH